MSFCVKLIYILLIINHLNALEERSFVIDYEHNTFLKDGKPFRYISGGIHYFRVLEEDWEDRLYKIRKSGCNAIQTYVAWNLHETYQGKFKDLDKLVKFIKLAQKHDLLVILRPGPYICAEWEFGGFPYWLQKDKSMKLRTSDPTYMLAIEKWISVLFSRIKPLLYAYGGPIIMVQVENEYGSFGCEHKYMDALHQMFIKYLGKKVVYFTTDGAGDGYLKCGATESIYTTIDFGAGGNPENTFKIQRKYQPKGPLVNSEYYTGWLDHWGSPHQRVGAKSVAESLDRMLAINASVNMYMFEGGTNFYLMNGANQGSKYQPQPTSYDYDAPLTEAGDPTEKYFLIQKVLSKYVNIPKGPQPRASEKAAYGKIEAAMMFTLYWTMEAFLKPISHPTPLSFEDIDTPYGYVIYRTIIPKEYQKEKKLNLTIERFHDRASVFVDKELQGFLDINNQNRLVEISNGNTLDILVENQGRVNYGPYLKDTKKGILSDVFINEKKLLNWKMYSLKVDPSRQDSSRQLPQFKPGSYHPRFGGNIPKELKLPFVAVFRFDIKSDVKDTYLKLDGWEKGIVLINTFPVGRYWNSAGPQKTLYVPKHILGKHNEVSVMETDKIPKDLVIEFVDEPILG